MTSSVIKRDAENGMERNTSGAYSDSSDEVVSDPETESDFVPPSPTSPLPLTRSEEEKVEQCTRIGLVATHKCSSDILTEDDRREMAAIRASLGMLPRKSERNRSQRSQQQARDGSVTEELSQSSEESTESEYEDNNCQSAQKIEAHIEKCSSEKEGVFVQNCDPATQLQYHLESKSESQHCQQSGSDKKKMIREQEEEQWSDSSESCYSDLPEKDGHYNKGHLISGKRVTAADTDNGRERGYQQYQTCTRGQNECTTQSTAAGEISDVNPSSSQYRVEDSGERFRALHHPCTVDCRRLQRKSKTCCGYSKCCMTTNTTQSACAKVCPKKGPAVNRTCLVCAVCRNHCHCQPCSRHCTTKGYFGETFCNFPLCSGLHPLQQQTSGVRLRGVNHSQVIGGGHASLIAPLLRPHPPQGCGSYFQQYMRKKKCNMESGWLGNLPTLPPPPPLPLHWKDVDTYLLEHTKDTACVRSLGPSSSPRGCLPGGLPRPLPLHRVSLPGATLKPLPHHKGPLLGRLPRLHPPHRRFIKSYANIYYSKYVQRN